ncbi:Bug family tripartite tricarboxylate transporter substrate binding protein [Siccirubricoccus phaeus]|uniref:Bug family tripartite tricarboxylate transporter substrate binding protein n=1 Tax=Siccirubricoccus phaeus TaxID=2595053 RepID=UPI00165BCF73|nr:tripartite tricarboxylate transporter substrate binding protein [Siccirubricoccus phaeus]
MSIRLPLLALAAALGLAAPRPGEAQAQAGYPDRPIRVVLPFAAGGGADIITRIFSDCLGTRLGQSIVVENRGGAGGNIGAEIVARAPADGYTLLVSTISTQVLNRFLYKRLPYDARKDFVAISQIGLTANVLIARAGLPATNVQELVALAKKSPGELSYGSSGTGTILHLSGEIFARMAGVRMTHVPYRGSALAMNDLLAGQLDTAFDIPTGVVQQVRDGSIRALAVTAKQRSPLLPEVPTLAESGLPDYETYLWHGLFAPAATPAPIVERLGKESQAALADPACRARLVQVGIDPVGSSPAEFTRFWDAQIAYWGPFVQASGVTLD